MPKAKFITKQNHHKIESDLDQEEDALKEHIGRYVVVSFGLSDYIEGYVSKEELERWFIKRGDLKNGWVDYTKKAVTPL